MTYVDKECSGEGDVEKIRLAGHGQRESVRAMERKHIPPSQIAIYPSGIVAQP